MGTLHEHVEGLPKAALFEGSPLLAYQALEDDDRPSSLAECLDYNNNVIPEKYEDFVEKEEELEVAESKIWEALAAAGSDDEQEDKNLKRKKKRKKRSVKSLKPFWINDAGEMVSLVPKQTYWYLLYVKFARENLECRSLARNFGDVFGCRSILARTLEATTQYAREYNQGLHLTNTYRSPHPALNVCRRHEAVASDTVSANCAAIGCGSTHAQLFIGVESKSIHVHGCKSDGEFIATRMQMPKGNRGKPADHRHSQSNNPTGISAEGLAPTGITSGSIRKYLKSEYDSSQDTNAWKSVRMANSRSELVTTTSSNRINLKSVDPTQQPIDNNKHIYPSQREQSTQNYPSS